MRVVTAVLVVLAGTCGSALAQEGDGPPLGGPPVRERRVPGTEQPFAPGAAGQRRAQAQLPHRAFMDAIRPLRPGRDSDAPRDLRLSDEQEAKIAALDEEYSGAMRRYLSEAREEMGGEAGRMRRGAGRDVPEGRPPADRLSAEQRARAEELIRDAPTAADWHTRMFAVLSEPQQEFVRARLEETRRRTEERRGQQEMDRRLRARDAAEQPAPPAGGARPAPGTPGRERLRRIAELMAQLPQQEREQMLSRIERELERRVQERGQVQQADEMAPDAAPGAAGEAVRPARRRGQADRPPR